MSTDEPDGLDNDLIADLASDGFVEGHELPRDLDSHVYDPSDASVERRQAQEGDFLSAAERESYCEAFDEAHEKLEGDDPWRRDPFASHPSVLSDIVRAFARDLAASMGDRFTNGTTQPPGDRVRVVRPEDLDGPLQGEEVDSIVMNECADIPPALWQGIADAAIGSPAIIRNWRTQGDPSVRRTYFDFGRSRRSNAGDANSYLMGLIGDVNPELRGRHDHPWAVDIDLRGNAVLEINLLAPLRTIEISFDDDPVGPYQPATAEHIAQIEADLAGGVFERHREQMDNLVAASFVPAQSTVAMPDSVAATGITAESIRELARSLRRRFPGDTGRPRRNW